MAGKKPGRPRKERPQGDEGGKIWGIRDVDDFVRHFIRVVAAEYDISIAEALKLVVIKASTLDHFRSGLNLGTRKLTIDKATIDAALENTRQSIEGGSRMWVWTHPDDALQRPELWEDDKPEE